MRLRHRRQTIQGSGQGQPATPPGGDAPAVEQAVYKKQRPEPDYLRRRFVELGCNMKAFARELGIARNTLYRWFEEAEIDPKTLRG